MTADELETGKNYFCNYQALVDPDTIPQLAGKEHAPVTTMNGIGQILQRDLENRLVEVIDLSSHKRYVVGFDDVFDIQEAE